MVEPSKQQMQDIRADLSQEESLQDLYGYYGQKPAMHDKSYDQYQQVDEYNLYQGCSYEAEDYHARFSNHKQEQFQDKIEGNLTQGFDDFNNTKFNEGQFRSQQVSIDIKNYQYSNAHIYRNNNILANNRNQPVEVTHYQNQNSRTVTALVSASKPRKYKSKKTMSQNSSTSSKSISTKNKFLQMQKEKKKNGDDSIDAVFLNPFTSLPIETMDVQSYTKFYKYNYEELVLKINLLQKKLSIMGEKVFFKDKDNQSQLNEIFKLTGLKTSNKLGKSKSIRQLKALFKYMNQTNQTNPEKLSPFKHNNFGECAVKFQSAYLAQFKQLMGFNVPVQELNSSAKKGLLEYGFGKLYRKR